MKLIGARCSDLGDIRVASAFVSILGNPQPRLALAGNVQYFTG